MSNATCLYTRNPPRMRMVKHMEGQNSVRAYRDSPEGVHLQLRLTGRYVGVSLSFDEARELVTRLQAAINDE